MINNQLDFQKIRQQLLEESKLKIKYSIIENNIDIINIYYNINMITIYKLSQILNIIQKNLSYDDIKCPFCSNHKSIDRNKFFKTCGSKDCVLKNTQKTNTLKYGESNVSKVKFIRNKAESTMVEKYGVSNIMHNDEHKLKLKQTCIEKFGTDNIFSSDEFKINLKNHNLEKHGVEHFSQSDEFKEKYKATIQNKYGVEHFSQSDEFKEKYKNTVQNKYNGLKHYSQTDEFKTKYKNTMESKYGSHSFASKHIENREFLTKEYIEEHFIKNKIVDLYEFMKFYNIQSKSTVYKKLLELNIDYNTSNQSLYEQEIVEWLLSKNIKVETHVRSLIKNEIDIYLPDHKVGIEFNGLYWHSFGLNNVSDNQGNRSFQYKRHLEKTEAFEKLSSDHQLFHIFENEWVDQSKQDIWKSVILNKLGLYETKIFARKCVIKLVDNHESNLFCYNNHIQGIRNSSINIGLYYNNELVSLMTFGKMPNKNDYELFRFCNKIDHIVIGAASKLLKYFELNYDYDNLISYANRRWSKGNLYNVLKFDLVNISKPNKFIILKNSMKMQSRLMWQKHKLDDKLEIYNKEYSADINIINNNNRIIWDSGNYSFIKKKL